MTKENLSLFEKFLYEAENDPPDSVDDDNNTPDAPPDLSSSNETIEEDAPELGDDPFSTTSEDENNNSENPEDSEDNLPLDEKISAIMNLNLYKRFLNLLGVIGNQISMLKNNGDVIDSLSKNTINILDEFKKLDENIRLYLTNYFSNENYSKNLLFFNKVLNLLKLLNDNLHQKIAKGVRENK